LKARFRYISANRTYLKINNLHRISAIRYFESPPLRQLNRRTGQGGGLYAALRRSSAAPLLRGPLQVELSKQSIECKGALIRQGGRPHAGFEQCPARRADVDVVQFLLKILHQTGRVLQPVRNPLLTVDDGASPTRALALRLNPPFHLMEQEP